MQVTSYFAWLYSKLSQLNRGIWLLSNLKLVPSDYSGPKDKENNNNHIQSLTALERKLSSGNEM